MNSKNIIALLIASLSSIYIYGQNYGNEWIQLNQTYYRLSIPKTGIYRVSGQQLQAFGIPLSSFNPQNIQLFFKGQEIPCYIEGENNGNVTYIEFYAEKNDGWFDTDMWDSPDSQNNPNISLINDTASVFLTWNNSFNNLRYQQETDVNFTGYARAPYCIATARQEYISVYVAGENHDSEFAKGEGYADNTLLTLSGSISKKISTPGFINNNIKTLYDICYLTESSGPHNIEISAPGLNLDSTFSGFTTIRQQQQVNVTSLDDETTVTFNSIADDNSGLTSRTRVSYISITYPRDFAINKSQYFNFTLPASPTQKTYVELTDFVYDGEPLLYDLTRGYKISMVADDNVLKALIPASDQTIDLLLVDENYIFTAPDIYNVNFSDYSAINKNYIILSHPKLWQEAQTYASYRNAALINVNNLYNQFGYGIQKHPMAIRNFLAYVYNTWSIKPEYLFIIGKGIVASSTRFNSSNYANCLVPPMGNPGSDVLLGNKIGNTRYESIIPIGRLAANTPDDVSNYLNKVIEFEENEPAEWMKHAIHFGGGVSEYEQNTFAGYLSGFENYFEDSLFGGYVSTFLKTSSDPIETSRIDSVTDLINNGVSIMTFFGHGHIAGFDQNIDEPAAYNNQGKYPLMIANSCYAGDMFTATNSSTSETWTLIPNKGTIAYWAMVYQGLASYLNIISGHFYKNLSRNMYGQPLGKIIKQSRCDAQNSLSATLNTKNTVQQFALHGDPAIVLNSFELPDLTIDNSGIYFSPPTITNTIDSFEVHVVLTNVSRTIPDTFSVALTRTFQDGTETEYFRNIYGLKYKDTVTFKLPVNQKLGQGLNQFTAQLDYFAKIEELNKANNSTTVGTYISSSDVFPIIPYNYGIHPSDTSVLKAATGDPFVKNQTSIFQLDTSYQFNSPYFFEEQLTHDGGVITWNTHKAFQANKTYFWRTAKVPENGEDISWNSSSFTYQQGINGWQQKSFGQFLNNSYKFIEPDENNQEFVFSNAPKILRFTILGINVSNYDGANIGYTVDGIGDYAYCQERPALHVVVIDSSSLVPWRSNIADYGQSNYPNCLGREANYFIFHLDVDLEGALDRMIAFINGLDNGYYVLIYTIRNGRFSDWKERHKETFDNWNANTARYLNDYQPYVVFMQTGKPEETQEWWGESDETLTDMLELKSNFTYGYIESPPIGPSLGWKSFAWEKAKIEDNPEETAFATIMGIKSNGDNEILIDSITDASLSLNDIDFNMYPYLKLRFFTRDDAFKTPTQLNAWQIIYTPVSDAALNPQNGWNFYSDSIQEGDTARLSIAIDNIGTTALDSLPIKYWLQNTQNKEINLAYKKIKPLAANQTVIDSLLIATRGLAGNNSIWIELNPETENGDFEQPEQNHFNNLLQKSFFVQEDESNPILDVTFDGVHIMNNDLVSAKPEIAIQLSDENSYIALNDTSVISLYLKDASGIEQKITISNNPEITFIEAQLPDNKAKLIYNHAFTEDGTYELRVRGKDEAGNQSGAFDYTISFRVINESTITNVFNYPNPFSTSTRFVFELTGSEIPDEMRIDILTITGKLVKVIYLSDLGNISIGKNISNYAWDGTDMYGDALANGVYFYRVYSKINGQDIKHRDTGTNQFFKNGFGKMYLIR